jgi:uncharacterized protein YkwD
VARSKVQAEREEAPPETSNGRMIWIGAGAGLVVVLLLGVIAWRFWPASTPATAPGWKPEDKFASSEPAAKPFVPTTTAEAPKPRPPRSEPFALQTVDLDQLATTALDRLNLMRAAAGLAPTTLDPTLSAGCRSHAEYAARNCDHPRFAESGGLKDEHPSLSGFSEEGRAAASVSLMAMFEPTHAMQVWLGRLASRLRLMQPDLLRIGFGAARNERGDWVCVVDAMRGLGVEPVAYPADKQKGVPLVFSGGPEAATGGYPVSLLFPPDTVLADIVAVLADENGNRVSSSTSKPDQPLPGVKTKGLIGILPKQALKPRSLYKARVTALVNDRTFEKAWEFITEDDADEEGVWAKKVLDRINEVRRHAGVGIVKLDPVLGVGCRNHARYLVLNANHPATEGLKAHEEDDKLPGATPEGAKAGKSSDLAFGDFEPIDAVEGWFATLYHRVPLLDPRLKTIGFGCARGQRLNWITVVDVTSGRANEKSTEPIRYPGDNQDNVPLEFASSEDPNPLPEKAGRAGFPITATFPDKMILHEASGQLEDGSGKPVPFWFSSPEQVANKKIPQRNTICLIPKAPLQPETVHRVTISGKLAGETWTKTWKFRTGAAGVSSQEGSRQLHELIDAARKRVGQPPVALAPELAKGCQAHADYLIRNADQRERKDFSMRKEEPGRPGFTAEGQESARQADIFIDAPRPAILVDDLLGTLMRRSALLNPRLRKVGIGCALEVGRGWVAVLDAERGIMRTSTVLLPAPNQQDVPIDGYDKVPNGDGNGGFPITAMFGPLQNVRFARGSLADSSGVTLDVWLSSPEGPFSPAITEKVIALHPRRPLRAGETYTVTIQAEVDGQPWPQQSWRFSTSK